MSLEKINPRMAVLLLIILAAASLRVPNAAQITAFSSFTPIGAMAMFGGASFSSRWKAFAFPLLALLVSDIIINMIVFSGKYGVMYSGWYIIYGIFVLIVLLGKWMIKKVTVKNVVITSIVAALMHWMIADFAVWMGGGTDLRTMSPLTRNWAGLLQCYVQGFPFMKNFLVGNLLYSAIMFGSFELLQRRYPLLKLQYA
jgi:hypothetical protein